MTPSMRMPLPEIDGMPSGEVTAEEDGGVAVSAPVAASGKSAGSWRAVPVQGSRAHHPLMSLLPGSCRIPCSSAMPPWHVTGSGWSPMCCTGDISGLQACEGLPQVKRPSHPQSCARSRIFQLHDKRILPCPMLEGLLSPVFTPVRSRLVALAISNAVICSDHAGFVWS